MNTHTPSPWLVRFERDKYDFSRSKLDVIEGSRDSLSHPQGPLVLAKISTLNEKESFANAYLISLAPDLLSALERLVHPMADDDDVDHAKELIARAKGQA
jgi:aromatic ring-cleaving dioxygenase